MAWADSLQAAMNELLMMPDGDNLNGGFYNANVALDRILKNGDQGGGESLSMPLLVSAADANTADSPYQAVSTSPEDNFRRLNVDWRYTYASDAISEADVKKTRGNKVAAANLLNAKKNVLTGKMKKEINVQFWTGDGTGSGTSATVSGVPSFWTGASYAGQTRASYTEILASSTAFDIDAATGGWTKYGGGGTSADVPESYQTYWDCTGAAISGYTNAEVVVELITDMIVHVGDSGDEPDFVAVSPNVKAQLISAQNKRGYNNVAGRVTLSDGGKLHINGVEVISDRAIPAQTAYVLNSRHIFFGSLEGDFSPKNFKVKVKDIPTYHDLQSLQAMTAWNLICRDTTRQGWLANLPA